MDDSLRKLHQVLYNYYFKNRSMPHWNVLIRTTGKSKKQLHSILNNMQEAGILEWFDSEAETIKLLQLPGNSSKEASNDAERYFTEY